VKKPSPIQIDPRDAEMLVSEILQCRPGYLPNWQPELRGKDAALPWIFARFQEAVLQRLNQVPEKNKLAFLEMFGMDLIPAQAARATLVFRLAENSTDTSLAAGAQVAAPPPPESSQRVIFETEQSVGLSVARLDRVLSLWPGRDQYIDHSSAVRANIPVQPFEMRVLEDTPHELYLAHDVLLALSGEARIKVNFELTQTSNEHLSIRWEYWDGEVWRGFLNQHADCLEEGETNPDSTAGLRSSGTVLLEGEGIQSQPKQVNGVEAYWVRGVLTEPLIPDPAQTLPLVDNLRLSTEIVYLPSVIFEAEASGALPSPDEEPNEEQKKMIEDAMDVPSGPERGSWLDPDQAMFSGLPVDTTQTFYPLGLSPKPGDSFYFASEEIFTKPGAQVTVAIKLAETPSQKFNITTTATDQEEDPLIPEVCWEYWDGNRWKSLEVASLVRFEDQKDPDDFRVDGLFRFKVPEDFQPTTVDGKPGWWVRGYLKEGGYGFTAKVKWNEGTDVANEYSYFVNQPPALRLFRLGYTWTYGPFFAEKVIAHNNFEYRDYTSEARWPGIVFAPYQMLKDVTPALYLGFTRSLPVDRLNLFFDVVEDPAQLQGPPLVWEYWNGFNWSALSVQDETNHLRVPGMLSFIGPQDGQVQSRFASSHYWLRGRLKEDGPPGAPVLRAIHPNAVWAVQRQTVVDEPLGDGNGLPEQVFQFRQVPILPGEIIEVRELSGRRANVEWRMLALEVLGDDYSIIQELERLLRQETNQAEIVMGDLRLRRDRERRVTEVWVCWMPQPNLLSSGERDRHYTLAHTRGLLRCGDGMHGRVFPLGSAIVARRYQTGGGRAGNLPAGAINQSLAAVPGLDRVSNILAASGGSDAEDLPSFSQRGPSTLRHLGRALLPADYETMAREASPAVAVARALPATDPAGRRRAGWITLIILPNSSASRPWPSFELRKQVERYIASRAPASHAIMEQIYVTGPHYQPVDVDARVKVIDHTQAGRVEGDLRLALERFFHPLHGGPAGQGWEPGRSVYLSDISAILERTPGVDYVGELALLIAGGLQDEHARIPHNHLAVAGQFRIQIEA
jgi:uncharacterized phage protein gp47/JayE